MEEPELCYSLNEEHFWPDIETVLDSTDRELKPGDTIYQAEAVRPEAENFVNVDSIIDGIADCAAGEHGEFCEDWLLGVSEEAKGELEKLVADWVRKHDPPRFFAVKNVRPYVLTEEDCND